MPKYKDIILGDFTTDRYYYLPGPYYNFMGLPNRNNDNGFR